MRRLILTTLLALAPLIVLASGFKSPHSFPKTAPWQRAANQSWRLSEQVTYYAEPGSGWEPAERYTLEYDSQDPRKITNVWNYYWDWFVGAWDLNYKVTHTYITGTEYISGSQISTTFSGEESPYGRTFVTYDAQMRLVSIAMEMWDWDLEDWSPWSKVEIEYLAGDEFILHNWFMGFEVGAPEWRRIEFQWDTLGRIIQETEYASMDSINWGLDNRITRTYHPNDAGIGSSFISALARLLPLTYYFDGDFDFYGMVETEQQDYWMADFTLRGWVPAYRDSYSYDAQDRLTQMITESWTGSEWEPYDRQLVSYDENHNLAQKTYASYSNWLMDWEDNQQTVYEWDVFTSQNNSPTAPNPDIAIRAYPAPFRTSLTIEVQAKDPQPVRLGIYNLKGQLVREYEGRPNQSLVWDGKTSANQEAAAGIYFIKVTQGKHSRVSKVMRIK